MGETSFKVSRRITKRKTNYDNDEAEMRPNIVRQRANNIIESGLVSSSAIIAFAVRVVRTDEETSNGGSESECRFLSSQYVQLDALRCLAIAIEA